MKCLMKHSKYLSNYMNIFLRQQVIMHCTMLKSFNLIGMKLINVLFISSALESIDVQTFIKLGILKSMSVKYLQLICIYFVS